jgi:hypothetical protein
VFEEDTFLAFNISASDIDGDALTLSASGDNVTTSFDDTTLTVIPNENYNGDILVTVSASDAALSSSTTFNLTVNAVNDAPTLDNLVDTSVAEDNSYTLELSGADIDGDELTFQASVDGNGSVNIDGSTLTVTPATNFNGSIVVSVIASDGQASGSGTFTLTVIPVNDAPVITSLDDQVIDEDTSLIFNKSSPSISDADILKIKDVSSAIT